MYIKHSKMASRNLTANFKNIRNSYNLSISPIIKHEIKIDDTEQLPYKIDNSIKINEELPFVRHNINISELQNKISIEIRTANLLFDNLVKNVFQVDENKTIFKSKISEISQHFRNLHGLFGKTGEIKSKCSGKNLRVFENMHRSALTETESLKTQFARLKSRYDEYVANEIKRNSINSIFIDTINSTEPLKRIKPIPKSLSDFTSEFMSDRHDEHSTMSLTYHDHDEETLKERSKEIEDIFTSVTELLDVFHDLSYMVNNQGEIIDRIDKTMESTVEITSKGVEQLRVAEKSQKKCAIM